MFDICAALQNNICRSFSKVCFSTCNRKWYDLDNVRKIVRHGKPARRSCHRYGRSYRFLPEAYESPIFKLRNKIERRPCPNSRPTRQIYVLRFLYQNLLKDSSVLFKQSPLRDLSCFAGGHMPEFYALARPLFLWAAAWLDVFIRMQIILLYRKAEHGLYRIQICYASPKIYEFYSVSSCKWVELRAKFLKFTGVSDSDKYRKGGEGKETAFSHTLDPVFPIVSPVSEI